MADCARRARQLPWISLVWMSLEGGIAIAAGILAGSIALIGFGIDSAIEGVASVVIIWRFTGSRMHSPAAESRAQKLVAFQFFLLAPFPALAVHVLVGPDQDCHERRRAIEAMLKERFGIEHTTIQTDHMARAALLQVESAG